MGAQQIDFDPNPCRACGGTGVQRLETERGYIAEDCWTCKGSGSKSVLIYKTPPAEEFAIG